MTKKMTHKAAGRASKVATPTPGEIPAVLDTSEGFLGVTNPRHRADALALPLSKLAELLNRRLCEQAEVTQRAWTLVEMAEENLPNDTDSDKSAAALWALRTAARSADNALCEFGGYFEALIVRAQGGGNHV